MNATSATVSTAYPARSDDRQPVVTRPDLRLGDREEFLAESSGSLGSLGTRLTIIRRLAPR